MCVITLSFLTNYDPEGGVRVYMSVACAVVKLHSYKPVDSLINFNFSSKIIFSPPLP